MTSALAQTQMRRRMAATLWCACATALGAGCDSGDRPPPGAPVPVVLAPEEVAVAAEHTLQTGPRVAGTLRARERATIIAQVNGAVLEVNAELGESVRKGEVLARVDAAGLGETVRSAEAAVESARQAAELAERDVERSARLARLGALAEQQLERIRSDAQLARAQLAEARARRAGARENLSETRVQAPLDGVVSEQAVYAGDVVSVGSRLFTIIDPSSLRLEASVPSAALPQLELGTTVEFGVQGQPGMTLHGEVARIAPAADPLTGQIEILVSIPNTDNRVLAGLFAQGRIVARSKRALAVPQIALDWTGEGPAVTAIRDARAVRLAVDPGVVDDARDLVEIRSGLAPGERVVLGPAREITPGTPVRVEERTELEGPAQARANERARAEDDLGPPRARPDPP